MAGTKVKITFLDVALSTTTYVLCIYDMTYSLESVVTN